MNVFQAVGKIGERLSKYWKAVGAKWIEMDRDG
jgi:hypothetical protein